MSAPRPFLSLKLHTYVAALSGSPTDWSTVSRVLHVSPFLVSFQERDVQEKEVSISSIQSERLSGE